VPERDKNGAPPLSVWRDQVKKIVNAHRAGKTPLLVPMNVFVKVDLATGRVVLDDPSTLAAGAVTVQPVAGQPTAAQARQLAIDVFPEIRKLVVGFIPGKVGVNAGSQLFGITLTADAKP